MKRTVTIDIPTFHVMNLIGRGFATDNAIRAELQADRDGRVILARDMRSPGRQVDVLASLGLITFNGDDALMTPNDGTRIVVV